jgi:glycosyltransferase involved in cell wall biosynthesis
VVANVKPIKRLDTLVEAFARIADRHPDTYVVIVGNDFPSLGGGSMMQELRELAERHRIGGRVIFTGGVERPVTYIRQFEVAVLCSDSEGFSNAIIEYMAEGRPVVCTETGGNPELVRDGVNGYLVPVGDATALAGRVSEILSDRDLGRRLGEAGREIVRTTYAHTRMVAEQMACYDDILAERGISPHEVAAK